MVCNDVIKTIQMLSLSLKLEGDREVLHQKRQRLDFQQKHKIQARTFESTLR